MQALAAWLLARPQNAVIGLAVTLILPLLQIFSGMFLVLVVLARGERLAALQAAIAGAVVTLVYLAAGGPIYRAPLDMLFLWVPAFVLAVTLKATRSLTLTLQVSALLLTVAAIWIFGIDGDVAGFAEPLTSAWLEVLRSGGMHAQAAALEADAYNFVRLTAFLMLWLAWMLYVIAVLFGYRWYRQVADNSMDFGRFSRLDFGRVIAVVMGVASVLAFLAGASWLENIAIVMLVVFWLQGLALVHWLYDAGIVPLLALIVLYVLLPVLNIVMVVGLAVIGYSDAWFRFRRRIVIEGKN